MKNKKYCLELTEDQVNLISKACEFYSRIGLGQLEEIVHRFRWNDEFPDRAQDEKEAGREALMQAKLLLTGYGAGASAGIFNPNAHEDNRVAYDIHQVIRNYLAWVRNPNGDLTIEYDRPMIASDQPLPKIFCEGEE